MVERTHTQRDETSTVTLAAHARRGLITQRSPFFSDRSGGGGGKGGNGTPLSEKNKLAFLFFNCIQSSAGDLA